MSVDLQNVLQLPFEQQMALAFYSLLALILTLVTLENIFFLPHFLSLSSLLRSLDIDSRGSSYNRENIVIRLTNDWL